MDRLIQEIEKLSYEEICELYDKVGKIKARKYKRIYYSRWNKENQHYKEYQKNYYMTVTKRKRQQKRKEGVGDN